MPLVTISEGYGLWYEAVGSGRPLVFVHGWSVDRRVWRQQVKHFARQRRVITVDLPGHGLSPWRPGTLTQVAGAVSALVRTVTDEPVSWVGSSLGGMVALAAAQAAPEQARTLTLVGSQPRFTRCEDYPHALGRERVEHLVKQLNADYPAMVQVFFRSLFTRQERETRRYRWIQIFRRGAGVPDKEPLLAFLEILAKEDLRAALDGITIPLQFVHGTDDQVCPAAAVKDVLRRLDGARADWFEGCGHFPFLSHPARFNEVLDDFLKSHG